MNPTRLVLGTANLGFDYGITNSKQYSQQISRNILRHAASRGINTFDTAAEYGKAEQLLGLTIGSNINSRIITKIPTRESYTYEYVLQSLESSLEKLKQKKIFGLMFHDPEIHKKKELREISKKLLNTGKIDHLGFSAYELDSVLTAKGMNPEWTIFQVPENILDRRLINSSELVEMANAGNYFYVRSVFLQGLLLKNANELPEKFKKYKNIFGGLQMMADDLGVRSLDLCLSYISEIAWSSGNIIAAASLLQLDEILDSKILKMKFDNLESLPKCVLDPRYWGEIN